MILAVTNGTVPKGGIKGKLEGKDFFWRFGVRGDFTIKQHKQRVIGHAYSSLPQMKTQQREHTWPWYSQEAPRNQTEQK